ncbi:MAG TPA: ATP-binding protein [Spirochaetota bacterium]|nr:ATP-binding protein [Spirochaetota bacterium]HPS87030.1 ATP-binding protein [Spirochaetota bacterium]
MILYQGKFPTTKKLKTSIITLIKEKLSEIKGKICIDLLDLNLILDEAIINAMEHGNKWDPAKNILIKISLAQKGIQIEIEDEGQGFDYFHKFTTEEMKPRLSERGRGLLLIQQFCDIEWTNCGNIIKINIPIELSA